MRISRLMLDKLGTKLQNESSPAYDPWRMRWILATSHSCQTNQLLLSPDTPKWLPSGHLAHHVSDLLHVRDLSGVYPPYESDGFLNAPYERQGVFPCLKRFVSFAGSPERLQADARTGGVVDAQDEDGWVVVVPQGKGMHKCNSMPIARFHNFCGKDDE